MNTLRNYFIMLLLNNLDRYVGICNSLNDLPNKVCVPNKTEDLNLRVFKMINGTNESKTLKKISMQI